MGASQVMAALNFQLNLFFMNIENNFMRNTELMSPVT